MPTCLNVYKRSFNLKNCICAVDFSRHNVPQMGHNRKENTQTLMQMQIQIRLQIECTTDDDVERDSERGGEMEEEWLLWVGRAYSGPTLMCFWWRPKVLPAYNLSPSLKHTDTNTPLHTNSPTRPTVCLATFVDAVVVSIPSMGERECTMLYMLCWQRELEFQKKGCVWFIKKHASSQKK